ncbi:acyltransferase [Alteromonas stellipolaris]|uniref:acyltransferase family protein n=1 Tax=Alteromonas stellipolaris TaxID=233316 RepID=UPI0007706417|nr:acyltransferase family protein [Alteromonas stellipolaris]AMJ94141.1 acyltransferase [Alteromonas stellipolaris]
MNFRKDINGLRAIAVVAVVLFHFNSSWMPGGFAGVDVFFVISGFLMTGIIFKKLENGNLSLLQFYLARANRIIPALALLCFVLLVLGWFYLLPYEYEKLGKHAVGSIGFISNIVYWRESGYFDASSHEKWLLHTWSLSVEWQFYIIYPALLLFLSKFISLSNLKRCLLLLTVIGFILCIVVTYHSPRTSYFLLHTRAWEMMLGGLAFLYPITLNKTHSRLLEIIGIALVIYAYIFFSEATPWPGFYAFVPVIGTYFVLISQRGNSIITSNVVSQKLGTWSYSIYLWHWPLVVAIYYFSLNESFIFVFIALSIALGFLSHKYVEQINFTKNFPSSISYIKAKPLWMVMIVGLLASFIFYKEGFLHLAPEDYRYASEHAKPSPYRDKCHLHEYQSPERACEYFNDKNVEWATLADSHSIEIAYALAKRLQKEDIGLKHFSFSGCVPSFTESDDFSACAKWYNESVDYIVNDTKIQNIVVIHRYTSQLVGGSAESYPNNSDTKITAKTKRKVENIDSLIMTLSKHKRNVFVFYPIPELPQDINKLIGNNYNNKLPFERIKGTSFEWYKTRNEHIIQHFDNSNYPDNVQFIKPHEAFCDSITCFAIKDGIPLYFDDDHASVKGAEKLVKLMFLDQQ